MLGSLALSLVLQSPPSATVDFTIPATEAPVVIRQFGNAVGEDLTVGKAFEDHVLALRLNDMEPREAMTVLAESLDAVWERVGDGWRLTRLDSVENELAQERRRALAARIAENLAERDEPEVFDAQRAEQVTQEIIELVEQAREGNRENWRQLRDIFQALPSENLALNVARALGPERLAAVGDGGRIVYSLNPTRAQETLPSSARRILNGLATQLNVQREAFQEAFGNRGFGFDTNEPIQDVLVVLLSEEPGAIELEVLVYDTNGAEIIDDDINIGDGEEFFEVDEYEPISGIQGDVEPKESLTKWLNGFNFDSETSLNSIREMQTDLLTAGAPDPLTSGPSEVLLQAAEATDMNLVALIPDVSLLWARGLDADQVASGEWSLAEGLGWLGAQGELAFNGETMVYRPARDSYIAQYTVNRPTLRFLVSILEEQRLPNLDDVAQVADNFDNATELQLTLFLASGFLGAENLFDIDEDELALLKFYNSMDATQRQAARSQEGALLNARSLSIGQQNALEEMIYGPYPIDFDLSREVANRRTRRNGLATEPTVLFGSGVPNDIQIRVRVNTDPQLVGRAQGSEFAAPLSTRRLAWQLERPGNVDQVFDRFLIGQEEELSLDLFTSVARGDQDLEVSSYDPNGRFFAFDSLPSNYQERVSSERAEIRQRLERRQEEVNRRRGTANP
jgi:chorismate mutase